MNEKMTQRDKVKRGAKGEQLITKSLKSADIWSHKLINYGYGTVFDRIIITPRNSYAVEIKTRLKPFIAYSLITENERNGLEDFMKKVGEKNSAIIGIWLNGSIKRAFWIPWKEVRGSVCSGVRGSINMTEFEELERRGEGWDFRWM